MFLKALCVPPALSTIQAGPMTKCTTSIVTASPPRPGCQKPLTHYTPVSTGKTVYLRLAIRVCAWTVCVCASFVPPCQESQDFQAGSISCLTVIPASRVSTRTHSDPPCIYPTLLFSHASCYCCVSVAQNAAIGLVCGSAVVANVQPSIGKYSRPSPRQVNLPCHSDL